MAQDPKHEGLARTASEPSPADRAAAPDVTVLYPGTPSLAQILPSTTSAPFASPGGEGPGSVAIGSVLNHIYEVRRFIARGGMGEVYEGVNVNTDERVAIKVVLPHLSADADVQAMFRKEARVLTRLSHPALVQYRVLANEPVLGVLYIVTDFLDGVGLDQFIGRLKLSPAEILSLMKRLAEGLRVAHDLGAIHRDISPDNILLPGERIESATIIDFGIAKDLESSHSTIVGDGFAGKLAFVAPEQFGDFGREIGPWTDIYSLGLVMLAVALGNDVDMGSTLVEAIDRRRAGPDLSMLVLELQPLFGRMLAANPKDRFLSMAELLEAIANLDLHAPPPKPAPSPRAEKPPRARKLPSPPRAEKPPKPAPSPKVEKLPKPSEPEGPPEAAPVMGASYRPIGRVPGEDSKPFDLQARGRDRKREGVGPVLPLIASFAVLALAVGGWFGLQSFTRSLTAREAAKPVNPATAMTMPRRQAMARISARVPGVTLDDWIATGKSASGYNCKRLRRDTEQWSVCGPDDTRLGKIAYEALGAPLRPDTPEAKRVAETLLWIVAPEAGSEEKLAFDEAMRSRRRTGQKVSIDQGDARIYLLTDRRGSLARATILPIDAATITDR